MKRRPGRWSTAMSSTCALSRAAYPREFQGLLGEAVRILEEQDEWVRVRMEQDGYLGWMPSAALFRCQAAYVAEYQASCQAMVSSRPVARRRARCPLPAACLYPRRQAALWRVRPGGRVGTRGSPPSTCPTAGCGASLLRPAAPGKPPRRGCKGIAFTLNLLHSLVGTPYLWGGRSAFGIDCSGLAGAFLRFMGLNPPPRCRPVVCCRHAGERRASARRSAVLWQNRPGDTNGRIGNITHVAISLGGQLVLHASSTVGGVQRNSLDPDSPIFHPWLKKTC